VTLWTFDALDGNITRNKQEYAEFEIITSDHIDDKAKALDISAELSLSLMSGFISLEGSAKFFMDESSHSDQSRVTLKYKTLSLFETLSQDHLGEPKYLDVFDHVTATHVCTGVQYGVDVFFVFEKSIEDESSKITVGGKLEAAVKSLQISGSIEGEIDADEKKFRENISCKYIGDYIPDNIPLSYGDAKDLMQDLPTSIRNASPTAKKIYLYPLAKIRPTTAKLMTTITNSTVSRVTELVQSYYELKKDIKALLDKYEVKTIEFLQEEADRLLKTTRLASDKFMIEIKPELPRVKGGDIDEAIIIDIIGRLQRSSYSPTALRKHFKILKKNFNFVKMMINKGKSNGVDMKIGEDPADFIGMDGNAIAFTFNKAVFKNSDLEYAYLNLLSDKGDAADYSPWKDIRPKELRKMNEIFKLFIGYAQQVNNEDKKFVIFCDEDCPDQEAVGHTTLLSWMGSEELKLPSIPGKPEYIEGSKTSTSLEIKIPTPEVEGDSYLLTVFENGVEVKTVDIPIDSSSKFTVTGLSPGMEHFFKVQSVSKSAGCSPKSAMSEGVVTDPGEEPSEPVLGKIFFSRPQSCKSLQQCFYPNRNLRARKISSCTLTCT
jgi:hypothetical protein